MILATYADTKSIAQEPRKVGVLTFGFRAVDGMPMALVLGTDGKIRSVTTEDLLITAQGNFELETSEIIS